MRNWFDDGLQFDLICRNDSKATDYFSSLCDQIKPFLGGKFDYDHDHVQDEN